MLGGSGSSQATASLEILAPLGEGGFGSVYEALDRRSGEHVAVKQLENTSADSIARFKQEFRAVADCHHPNLVSLKELIGQDGRWLIVMELVPGTDLLGYIRGADNDNDESAPLYDEARLRSALIGVVEGLRALHSFGLVHRDLKPSNVRVRPDGRAVLLDFGLATSVDPRQQSTHTGGVGTAIYMAPEQAGGTSIGPAADMYALGVCLFEALTGRAPFEGAHAIKILLDKQRLPAPRARSLADAVPLDLDELCARLLAIDPTDRPPAEEVLGLLSSAPAPRASMPNYGSLVEPSFAGRESELEHLERALLATHEGEQRIVLVEGESGIGKSELVSEFLRRAQEGDAKLVPLRGRCYENEQVSYKAFDGCIDELAKLLRRMPEPVCNALLPERAALLGQLFPVLRNVPSIARAPREGSSADPTARRLEAFTALSQLLSSLAEERAVVLVLDDMQWADAESFRLLAALCQSGSRAPVLFAITVRPRAELEGETQTKLDELRMWSQTNVITLFGLPREQARSLAERLLGKEAPSQILHAIAVESHGHPLFISELVQYTQSHDSLSRNKLTIEAALCARIEALPRVARDLLDLVALAARPYPASVFSAALEQNIDEVVRDLLAQKLLRQRRGHEFGCFHDRIRHASANLIVGARIPVLHHKLAGALAQLPEADPSEQARHWEQAGQAERASEAYEHAGTNALGALAFARAAEQFGRALSLLNNDASERWLSLTTQRADALAWAGRSGEAATLYGQAAEQAKGETRIRLRSLAASHLLLSAQLATGLRAARQLMAELGFSLPARNGVALLRYVWERIRGAVARPARRAPEAITSHERVGLNAAQELLAHLVIVHPLAYLLLYAQWNRHRLRIGTEFDAAYATAQQALRPALRGAPYAETQRQLLLAREATPAGATPEQIAKLEYVSGATRIAASDFEGAVQDLERAHTLAREHCRNNPWLLTRIRFQLGTARLHLGQHRLLADESDRWLAEATERNDVLAAALIFGLGAGYCRHLMRDDPEAAIAEAERLTCSLPCEPYSFAHLGLAVAMEEALRSARGGASLAYIDEYKAKHKGAYLLRTPFGRAWLTLLRTLAEMEAIRKAGGARRRQLVRAARRSANLLLRARSPHLQGAGLLAVAQLDILDGLSEHAREALRRVAPDNFFSRTGATYLSALLESRSTHSRRDAVLEEFRSQGWTTPERGLSIYLPLHDLIEHQLRSSHKGPWMG